MPRAGVIDVREAIEGEFSITGKTRSGGSAVDFLVCFVAFMCSHGIDQAAATRDLLKCSIDEAFELPMGKALMEIADPPQFFFDVAILDFRLVCTERFPRC